MHLTRLQRKYKEKITRLHILQLYLNNYKSYKDSSAILTFQEAKDLLKADLGNYQTKSSVLAKETGLTFSQNEMDGITSLVYKHLTHIQHEQSSSIYFYLDINGYFQNRNAK